MSHSRNRIAPHERSDGKLPLDQADLISADYRQVIADDCNMPDRIQFDSILRNEFCLTKVFKRTADSLSAEAVWHEDIQDPGDASLVDLRLERVGDTVTLTFWDAEDGPSSSAVGYRLRRH